MTKQYQELNEEVWPGLLSILIPAIQLVAAFSIGFVDALKFDELFLFSDSINLINLCVSLTTLSIISLFWYWRNNSVFFIAGKKESKKYKPYQEGVRNTLITCSLLSFLTTILFVGSVFLVDSNALLISPTSLGFLQILFYVLLINSSGLAIYVWVYEFIQKKQSFQRGDFVPNLVNALRNHNMIPQPNVKVLEVKSTDNSRNRIVDLEIDDQRHTAVVTIDGMEIMQILPQQEFYEDHRAQKASNEQLQSQVERLLETIAELQAQINSTEQSGGEEETSSS